MAQLSNGNGSGNGHGRPSKVDTAGLMSDRLPPQNLEAEQGVLGSILLQNDVLHEVIPILNVEDFYRDAHQIVYRAIRDLYDKGLAIDHLILADELSRRNEIQAVGGMEFLAQLVNATPHAANAMLYAGLVREKSIIRQLVDGANGILQEGYSNNFTADQLLEAAEQRIFTIQDERTKGDTVELKDVVELAMDRIVQRSESRHPVTGVATGFFDLDDITGGFQQDQLIIVAARPSMGKTAFALNVCDHISITQNIPVLFVSLEMGELELAERLICARSKVDGDKLRTGRNMGSREISQLGKAYDSNT